MPSGRTHDRITLRCLPFVVGATYLVTYSLESSLAGNLDGTNSLVITAIVALAFLVGGFMLGPDLDIHSIQYKRWGLLRWIWLPYQKALKHRSALSHGPIIGTAIRVIYMGVWVGIFTLVLAIAFNALWDAQLTSRSILTTARHLGNQYITEWIAAIIGLELGAISHSVSDVVGSHWVRSKNAKAKRRKKKHRR